MKGVLRPNGILIITTRPTGFPYHAYPYDYWRYILEDFNEIFSDLEILVLERDDKINPGVLIKAKKPLTFSPRNLENVFLYSVISCSKASRVPRKSIKRKIQIQSISKLFRLKTSVWERIR
jgi:hypothetical protein